MKPLRVALNALYVGGGVAGGRVYRDGLLRGLAALDTDDQFDVFTRRQPTLPELPARFRAVEAPVPDVSTLRRTIHEYGILPHEVFRGRYSVYHALGNLTPRVRGAPTVLTVHDLIHRHFPASVPTGYRLFMRAVLPRAARRADCVVVDSEYVGRQVVEELGVREDRVRVVPLGVGEEYRPADPETVAEVLTRFGVRPPYLLAVGRGYPHKNVAGLLRAVARLHRSHDAQLVLVGDAYRAGDEVDRLTAELGLAATVVRTGFVSAEELGALYAGATAFAFPSLSEGFGLPPLEAMARGVPVVASSLTAVPEVVGDAGLLADPRDPEAFADALGRVLGDSSLRAELRAKGFARAKAFTWERCAAGTLAVYRELT